jgi:hypothetical protein
MTLQTFGIMVAVAACCAASVAVSQQVSPQPNVVGGVHPTRVHPTRPLTDAELDDAAKLCVGVPVDPPSASNVYALACADVARRVRERASKP